MVAPAGQVSLSSFSVSLCLKSGLLLGMEKKAGIWGESGYAEEMDVKN